MSYRCIYQKLNSFNCSMLVLSLFVCDFVPPIISINREGIPVQFILQPLNTNIPSTVQSALVNMKGLLIITPCAALFVAIFGKFVFLTVFFFCLFVFTLVLEFFHVPFLLLFFYLHFFSLFFFFLIIIIIIFLFLNGLTD